jgi:hypothetical protein
MKSLLSLIKKVQRSKAPDEALQTLLVLILLCFISQSLLDNFEHLAQIALSLLLLGMFISGTVLIATTRFKLFLAACSAASVVIARGVTYYTSSETLRILDIIANGFFIYLLITAVSGRVIGQTKVNKFTIQGSIVIYLLAVLFWGQIYAFIEVVAPSSFQFTTQPKDFGELHRVLTYFSFTMITSSGFGNILPVSATAQVFSVLQACFGILYPAILIGRLVSLELMSLDSPDKG